MSVTVVISNGFYRFLCIICILFSVILAFFYVCYNLNTNNRISKHSQISAHIDDARLCYLLQRSNLIKLEVTRASDPIIDSDSLSVSSH